MPPQRHSLQSKSTARRRSARLKAGSSEHTKSSQEASTLNESVTAPSVAVNVKRLPVEWQLLVTQSRSLLVGFDFGTTKYALTWAFQDQGTTVTSVHIRHIEIGSLALPPSLIGFRFEERRSLKTVRFVHGQDLKNYKDAGEIEPEHILENLKQSEAFEPVDELDELERRESLKRWQDKHNRILKSVEGYESFISHPWCGNYDTGQIESIRDVARIFFRLILMDTKVALQMKSNLSKDEIDELFEGSRNSQLGTKIRVGVAVPELWGRQRLTLYTLLIEAGWPPSLEILSEPKCAAAMVLRTKCDEFVGMDADTQSHLLDMYHNRPLHIIDRGGHTLDQSTMAITSRNGFIKFVPVVESTSTRDGGNRANDEFLRLLPDLFGSSWSSVLAQVTQHDDTINEFRFILCFLASFEQAKRSPFAINARERQTLPYASSNILPYGRNSNVEWMKKKLVLPKKQIEDCVKRPVQVIMSPHGPLNIHHKAARKAVPDAQIEIIATGGASLDPLFQEEIRKKYPETSFQTVSHTAQSFVAQGIILSLLDTDLCNDSKIANISYGIVHCAEFDPQNPIHRNREKQAKRMAPHMAGKDIKGRKELPDTVAWLARRGNRVRQDTQTTNMQQVLCIEDHPREFKDELSFNTVIVQTDDPALSLEDGHDTKTPGIKISAVWKIPISKSLAKKIARPIEGSTLGFVRHAGKNQWWQLEFDYRFRYRWLGMLQIFEICIPYGGYFPEDRELEDSDMYIERFSLTGDVQMAADM